MAHFNSHTQIRDGSSFNPMLVFLNCTLSNATQVSLCESHWHKLENMKNEPNNTHSPYHKIDDNILSVH